MTLNILNHNQGINSKLIEYASMDTDEVLEKLGTSVSGLKPKEISERIDKYGKNILVKEKKENLVLEYLSYFNSPLIIVLIGAAILASLMKEITDATIILSIIIISATINFFQSHNSNKAIKSLKSKIATTSTVVRNGVKKEIPIQELVPGDIIELSAGDIVPGDARIIKSNDFFVDQASFTGESYPQEKVQTAVRDKNVAISDLNNIVFSNTSVVSGSATAVILLTGKSTQFGKIAEKLESKTIKSDFEKGLNKFSYFIMRVTIVLVLFIFLFEIFFRRNQGSLIDFFLFSIAVAVGIMPSLLPMILSITMAKGSITMSKKGVFVQKLNAIPNFGSMDVLCTDKTGTLTENKIALFKALDIKGNSSDDVFHKAYLNSFFQTGLKNPMDGAVLNYKRVNVNDYDKADEIPFDFVRRRLSIIVNEKKHYSTAGKNIQKIMITKGAPENVFKVSKYFLQDGKIERIDSEQHKKINDVYKGLSKQGFRVLAIAIKSLIDDKKVYSINDERNLVLIGFLAFYDPPKHDVAQTIRMLNKRGIEVKVITGDNELVSKKICEDIHLNVKGVLTGADLDKIDDDALRVRVEKTTIFARLDPEDKDRIIRALKLNNHIVGYMGDGINDAPSLKTADVGISVNSAVDVAKSTADIVLTHKSLRELNDGVYEGRKIFVNTMKYLMFTLSSNFGNMFSVVGAVIYIPFLPMLPAQILLNNLLSDVSQMSISTDNVDAEVLEKPKKWNLSVIKKFMYVFGPASSIFDFITFYLLFSVFKVGVSTFQTGWFLESLATQILVIHILRTKKIGFLESMASKSVIFLTFLVLIIGWVIPFTPIAELFGFVKPPLYVTSAIIIVLIGYLYFIEIVKHFFYKKYNVF